MPLKRASTEKKTYYTRNSLPSLSVYLVLLFVLRKFVLWSPLLSYTAFNWMPA